MLLSSNLPNFVNFNKSQSINQTVEQYLLVPIVPGNQTNVRFCVNDFLNDIFNLINPSPSFPPMIDSFEFIYNQSHTPKNNSYESFINISSVTFTLKENPFLFLPRSDTSIV
jgi:hypothetical protein